MVVQANIFPGMIWWMLTVAIMTAAAKKPAATIAQMLEVTKKAIKATSKVKIIVARKASSSALTFIVLRPGGGLLATAYPLMKAQG
jgi:hypothetical protein